MFLFGKSVEQIASLPFVVTTKGVRVLIITSRHRQRWILPKGWPMKGMPLARAAAKEAEEEAGVLGTVHRTPIGSYSYDKQMDAGYDVPCRVYVYPLLVGCHRLDWNERKQRKLRWVSLRKAAKLVDDDKLKALLAELAAEDGQRLIRLAEELPLRGDEDALRAAAD